MAGADMAPSIHADAAPRGDFIVQNRAAPRGDFIGQKRAASRGDFIGQKRAVLLAGVAALRPGRARVTGTGTGTLRCGALLALVAALLSGAGPVHGGPPDRPAARPLQQFTPPAAGSYALPVIQRAPAGTVLDVDGRAYPLSRYTMGKVTLLSFVYSYCVDPVGCPLAYDTFVTLRQRLLRRPALAQQVRLVSLSFDPGNDTPSAMRAYGGTMLDPASPLRWHFLTSRSVAELKPIIDGFGQDVSVTLDERGRPTRLFNHLLKIFLIDAAGQVREIYTTAYLMPDVLLNDVDTVLRADNAAGLARRRPAAPQAAAMHAGRVASRTHPATGTRAPLSTHASTAARLTLSSHVPAVAR